MAVAFDATGEERDMSDQGERRQGGPPPDTACRGLGPPGWPDFVAARRRFEATLALQGLERAVAGTDRPPVPRRPERPAWP